MSTALQINQKTIPYRPYRISSNRQNFEGSGKILAVPVSEIYHSIGIAVQYVFNWTTVSVIRESLFISVCHKDDFVVRFC